MRKFYPIGLLLLVFALLGGCASQVPDAVRKPTGEPLSVLQAQASAEALRGKRVRWGGEILSVSNHPRHTDIVVLRRGLYNDGEPRPDGGEAKRFVARIEGFLEPAEYAAAQRLTVVGTLAGLLSLPVGEYDYPHPLVRVENFHRWPKYEPPAEPLWYRDPFFCDPFWPGRYRYPYYPYCW
jgi:outer membrane lipoprotein